MRIEDLTQDNLKSLSDKELFNLRLRAVQVFEKCFSGNALDRVGTLSRGFFLSQYEVLQKEIRGRGLRPAWADLDSYFLRYRMMEGLDPAQMGDVLIKSGSVVIGGQFAHNPRDAEVCDVFVSPMITVTPAVESFINVNLTKQLGKPVVFHYGFESYGDAYIPIFDLKLCPRAIVEKVMTTDKMDVDCVFCHSCGTSAIPEDDVQTDCPDCGKVMCNDVPLWKEYKDDPIIVAKPGFDDGPNEIKYRVRDPKRFQEGSFRRIALQSKKPRVFAIIGKLTGETSTTIQALRFPKGDGWTVAKARAWVKSHSSVTKNSFDPMGVDVLKGIDDAVIPEKESVLPNRFQIVKVDDDEHIVGGVVYEPGVEDAQGDYSDADEIRKAAYHFMENSQCIRIMHNGRNIQAAVLENYLAPVDFEINEQVITKGTWWMSVRVQDDEVWADVKAGKYTGFSMGGMAQSE
jgi:hypothetical protein